MSSIGNRFIIEQARNATVLGILGYLTERGKTLQAQLNKNKCEINNMTREQMQLNVELKQVRRYAKLFHEYYINRPTEQDIDPLFLEEKDLNSAQ